MTTAKTPLTRHNRDNLTILALVVPLRALFLMLGLGVLHNDWTPQVPALGFWASLAVAAVFPGGVKNK